MEASIKYRIVGSVLVIMIALVISPLFLKETKPAWLVKEDEKSLSIPAEPDPINVASIEPKEEWKLSNEAVEVIAENKQPEEKIKIAEVAFAKQQTVLSNQAKQAIVEQQFAEFTPFTAKERQKGKKNTQKKIRPLSQKSLYSLQLATFSDSEWAERLLKKLEKQGVKAYLSERTSESGTVFTMVMTGRSSDLDEIKRLQTKLDQAVHVKSLIIKHA